MKNKNLLIGIGIILLLVAAIFYFIISNKTNTLKKELSNFAVKDTASITKIFIADRTGQKVTLVRLSAGEWEVNGKYPAKKAAIATLLETMHGISVKSTVPKPAFNNVVKRLATQAVKVEIYKDNELYKTYYVGGATKDYYGTYMMMENSATPFVMWLQGFEGFLTTRYFVEENLWRSTVLLHNSPLELASVKIEYPQKSELSFELRLHHPARNPQNMTFDITSLKTGKQINFDTNAVKAYLLGIREMNVENIANILNPKTKDSTLALTPMHLITITDIKGKQTFIKSFPRKGRDGQIDQDGNQLPYDLDRFYIEVKNEPHLFMVQYTAFDKLLKPITYFEK